MSVSAPRPRNRTPHLLAPWVFVLLLTVAACSGEDAGSDEAADTVADLVTEATQTVVASEDGDDPLAGDGPDAGSAADSGDLTSGHDEITLLCEAYDGLLSVEQARFTFVEEAEVTGLESERQERLAALQDLLGPDAPPGVLDAIDVLFDDYPVTAEGTDYTDEVDQAFLSLTGYIGPICGTAAGPEADGELGAGTSTLSRGDLIVTLGGVGEIGIGMEIQAAADVIGFDTTDATFQQEVAGCAYMDPGTGSVYVGTAFMVFDEVVQRIDVFDPELRTPSGVGVGSTEDDLAAAYGDQLVFSPHPYDDTGSYVEFVPNDPGNDGLLLLFETSEGVVTAYRVGYTEPVQYIEGCA